MEKQEDWRDERVKRIREEDAKEEKRLFESQYQQVPWKFESWYCDKCAVEVKQVRCKHCGKSKEEES